MGNMELDVLRSILSELTKINTKLDTLHNDLWSITGENSERYGTSLKDIGEQLTENTTALMEHMVNIK